jgi:Predicted extracellular nuclease
MIKNYKLFILLILFSLSLSAANAQIKIFEETLATQESFDRFTAVNVTGFQSWYCNEQYGYAVCSGYDGQSRENEDWLISPELNMTSYDNVKLSFDHTRGSTAVVNVGVAEGWYKVFATANYTGDPATTTWVELEGVNQYISVGWQWVLSGKLDIPASAKSANTRIAFRYISSNTQSSTWQVRNVLVTGEAENLSGEGDFKITNWNVEWFGCMTNGPDDDELQLANVVTAMRAMNADIYCVQEVSHSSSFRSINELVAALGSEWGGNIVPYTTNDCGQNQGIIYRKSKVQYVNSQLLNTGNSAQGNSYSYNWSSGRYPALYNINLLLEGGAIVPVSLINIHAKAFDDESSYTRRLGASEGLKTILDGNNYNSKNVIITGDFNDYLIGTMCSSRNNSPYKNFIDDTSNWRGITNDIINVGIYWGEPIIENFIISNELFDEYIDRSAMQEVSVAQNIYNFFRTTSDHIPVSALFNFSVTADGIGDIKYSDNSLQIYPNPVIDELKIKSSNQTDNSIVEIYDLTGKQLFFGKTENNTINVSTLSTGIYILKVGDLRGKFVKE